MSASPRSLGRSLLEAGLVGALCVASLGLWVAFRALPFHQTASSGDRFALLAAFVVVYAVLGWLMGGAVGMLVHVLLRGRRSMWLAVSFVFAPAILAWFFAVRWGLAGGPRAGAVFGFALGVLLVLILRRPLRGRAGWAIAAVLLVHVLAAWRLPLTAPEVEGDPAVLTRLRELPDAAQPPLLVLAIDGMEREILEEGIARGELPNLARIWSGGLRAPLRTLEPTWSPPLWTSFWTGKLPKDHGINYFLAQGSYDLPGVGPVVVPRLLGARRLADLLLPRIEVPINQALRRATTVWEALGLAGRTCVLANRLVSWPVLPVRGVELSNRLLLAQQDATGLAYPESLGVLVLERLAQTVARSDSALAPAPWLARGLARERALWQFALEQSQSRRADLTILYTHLVDSAQHRYLKYHWPSRFRFAVDPERLRDQGGIVRASYRGVDAMVGDALAALPGARVLLISDHGVTVNPTLREDLAEPVGASEMLPVHGEDVSGVHGDAPDGVFALIGPDVPARQEPLPKVDLLAIAPLMLRLLGLPAAADMELSPPGTVLGELAGLGRDPGTVSSYEGFIPRQLGLVGGADDPAVLEQLRALGYIE